MIIQCGEGAVFYPSFWVRVSKQVVSPGVNPKLRVQWSHYWFFNHFRKNPNFLTNIDYDAHFPCFLLKTPRDSYMEYLAALTSRENYQAVSHGHSSLNLLFSMSLQHKHYYLFFVATVSKYSFKCRMEVHCSISISVLLNHGSWAKNRDCAMREGGDSALQTAWRLLTDRFGCEIVSVTIRNQTWNR